VQPHHEITEDGLEKQFEVNDLACFILTLRLLPLMKKTAESAPPASVRIVFQTSEIHRLAPGDTEFASVEEINAKRDSTRLYDFGIVNFKNLNLT
jgi:NAD(P)-dependent dehydrogenase (short-subunit alcohol dehydrogenase family)